MKIQPLYISNYTPIFKSYCPKPSLFKSNSNSCALQKGQITTDGGKVFIRHGTSFLRGDIDWGGFSAYLNERFKDTPEINTMIYACSDGSEVFSLATLLYFTQKNPERFLPIKAFDIDSRIIKKSIKNKNQYQITENELKKLKKAYNVKDEEIKEILTPDMCFSENITKLFDFKCSNILEDVRKFSPLKPTLLMCRNMWAYVNPAEYQNFADKLHSKLAKNSVVVLGYFDCWGDRFWRNSDKFPQAILKAGFTQTNTQYGTYPNANNLVFERN